MGLYGEVAAVFLVALVFLFYVGYGFSKLLLPDELQEHEGLLVPFVGFAVTAFVAYYSVNAGLNLSYALVIILAVATAANAYALLRRPRGLRFEGRSSILLFLMVVGVFAVGIAPLLYHGYLTVIGESWDVEFYLPLAEYLKTYPQTGLLQAPSNPAIRLLTTTPTSGRGMGLTYLHSLVSLITNANALSTFALVLSLMRALSLLPAYVFARKTLGLGRNGSLIACGFLALSEPLLWVTFNSFAMHVGSLGLLPLLVTSTEVALARRNPRAVGFAAFIFAAVAITYYPALTAYAVLGAALGLYYLSTEKQRGPVLKAAGATIGLGLILSFLAQIRFPDGFLGPFGDRVTSLGILSFAPLSDLYGLSFFFPLTSGRSLWVDLGSLADGHLDLVGGALTSLAILLSLYALWKMKSSHQRLVPMLAAGCAIYLLVFRFITKSQYGFFKGATFLAFILWALVAIGLANLWSSDRGRMKLPARAASLTCAVLLLAATAFNSVLLVGQYWVREPPLYGPETLELGTMASLLAPGSSVYVSGDPNLPKTYLGLVSYFLEGHETYGDFSTGFSLLHNPYADRPPNYALLSPADDPTVLGYSESDLLWVGERLRLYRKNPALLAQFGPAREDDSPRITRTQPHTFSVLADRIIDREMAFSGAVAQKRMLVLGLASFVAQRLTVQIGDSRRVIELAPGFTEYSTETIQTPTEVRLFAETDEPIFLRWTSLREANGEEVSSQVRRNDVLFQSRSLLEGDMVTTKLKLAAPAFGTESQIIKLRASLDGSLASSREAVEIGDWEFWAGSSSDIQIESDLKGPGIKVFGDGRALEVKGAGQSLPDGRYSLSLAMVAQNRLAGSRQLFVFEVKGGKVVQPLPDDAELAIIYPPSPQHKLDLLFDEGVSLLGYTLDKPEYQAGAKVEVDSYWRGLQPLKDNYVISLQLTDSQGQAVSLAEGEPDGGKYRTSVWPSGEIVEDRREFVLSPTTPPGKYLLQVGVYDPATRRWLAASSNGQALGVEANLGEVTVK